MTDFVELSPNRRRRAAIVGFVCILLCQPLAASRPAPRLDSSRDGAAPGPLKVLTSRPERTWWPLPDDRGLAAYGHVKDIELDALTTLILPNSKGSLDVTRPGAREELLRELRTIRHGQSPRAGQGDYFLTVLAPGAFAGSDGARIRRELLARGLETIEFLPTNGFLVRAAGSAGHASLADKKTFRYVSAFEAPDKIHPATGRKPLIDAQRASSGTLELVIRVMPGEEVDALAATVRRLGGEILQAHDVAGEKLLSANVAAVSLLELADDPAVYGIWEALEYVTLDLVTSAQVEMGRFLDPRDFGDFLLPFRAAGVDGGGVYGGALPNYANPNPGAALTLDPAQFTVQPQFLGVADNGLTLDSPAFANDNTHPCLTGPCAGGVGGLTGVGSTHRKVEVYTKGNDVNNDGTVDDVTSSGDFLTCDSIRSGGHTHGTVAAGGAAANPSSGPLGLGRLYKDVDAIDQFNSFFNDTRESGLSLDGQAPGARVIFEDIAVTPVSSPPACATNYLSDVDAGDVPAARLQDLAFRRDLNPAGSTLHARGAKVTLFAFGNPVNFDGTPGNGNGNYANGAGAVDAFLFANRRVLHVQAVGNDGANAAGGDINPFDSTDPNDTGLSPGDIQVNDLATAKNVLTVGANYADSINIVGAGFTTDPSETVANFTSKGPATFSSLRGAPLVLAPGIDISGSGAGRGGTLSDDYFVSLATVVSFDNANDIAGSAAVENVVVQGEAGTSVAAGKIAGAALQVRDYFAKGFYPTASATAGDRVSDMSGMLVKALLINSTDFAQQGPLLWNCFGRGPLQCLTEQGYGKVELANTLPLTNYRAERRPPNTTNVADVSNVPQGLLVVDEYFDGGARGSAADGSTTGIGVVPVGGSVSFDFIRRHGNDQLRVSLAWYDAQGETLLNDLDLTVLDGDYDYANTTAAAGTGLCTGTASTQPACSNPSAATCATTSVCGRCSYASVDPGSGGYFDPTANNPYVALFHGNQFRDFGGQYSLRAMCDASTGAELTDLAANPQNATDTRNPTESVMLGYLGDPVVFGPTRSGGGNGYYRARVSFKNTASSLPVPHAPVIASGANGLLDTAAGGDDTVLTFANGQQYIGAGVDGIADTVTSGDDVQLIPNGSFGQPFALAIAGPVFNARLSSVISLNRDLYDCSEKSVFMRVADGSVIPANLRAAEIAANVAALTSLQVLDPNGVVRDVESGWTFAPDAGLSTLRVSRQMHYSSSSRRLQFISDRPGASEPIPDNGLIEVKDGWTLRATYDDQSPTSPGGPSPGDAVTSARVSCAPFLGSTLLAVSGESPRRTLVSGGCDVGRMPGSRGDYYLDAAESVIYQVGFANQSPATPVNLKATLTCLDPSPGGADPCASLTIANPVLELGLVPPGREGVGAWTIQVASSVTTLATADRAVDLQVTFTSRSTDYGSTLATQVFTFREALQADFETLRYHTDLPAGGRIARDLNRDGLVDVNGAELRTYLPLNNAGNPNLSASAMMPWRFDTNNGGFTAFRAADSRVGAPGSVQNQLAWFYSTGGGCGWQTQNNGVAGAGPNLPKGTWHAGHGPVGAYQAPGACPPYVAPSDPLTPPFVEFIRDVLDSPVLFKVNQALDSRGMPFDLRIERTGWNEASFLADGFAIMSLEVDSNLDDDGPVVLGDTYAYRVAFSAGGPTLTGPNARTFGPPFLGTGGSANERYGIAVFGTGPTAFPAYDVDANTPGFQGITATDPNTGLPIIPGRCTASICIQGADAKLGTACSLDSQCTGPGTRIGHDTPWGPVRNREISLDNTLVDFRGASGTRFQLELAWTLGEGAQSALGWTVDDPYLEWSETHAGDQAAGSANECASIPSRPGANTNARQCATLAIDRNVLHNCTTSVKVTLADSTTVLTAGTLGCAAGMVPVNLRSGGEPLGETFCLAPSGGGLFTGEASLSALSNAAGVLFVNSTSSENSPILASYRDPECDMDGDATLGENAYADLDGDAIPNAGADGSAGDMRPDFLLAEGQGASDDDNCFDGVSIVDVYNPAGLAQRDNNGAGGITQADCPVAGQPHGRSPLNGQCDWDNDGFGDLCDNCPLVANADQLDSDGDGIGSVCETTDIDHDTIVNTADNCPTLYNPSQTDVCGSFADVDGDLVVEANDNCPNAAGDLESGVPHPPFTATYNPDQLDADGDGIGDKCDLDDFDADAVDDAADSCPTIYNPADPTFGIQADSDHDGLGDDRTNIDIVAGASAYCDPDSADDNNDGLPDDLIQFAARLDCNYTQFQGGGAASVPQVVGSFTLAALQVIDDGTADPICTAGDPNPGNDPTLIESCPGRSNAQCDTPGAPGTGICASVPDGVPDAGELTQVRLTVTNNSIDRQTGLGRDLTNLTLGLRALTPSVGCVPRSQTFVGALGDGLTVQTASNTLSFIIDPANPGPGQTIAPLSPAMAALAVTAQADGMEGISPELTFSFPVDLDRQDFTRIAAACPQFPAANAPGVLCEDFDTDRNGVAGFQFTRLPVGQSPTDILLANGDPNDDVLGYAQNGAASPAGTAGSVCSNGRGLGRLGCDGVVQEENDWHLHSPYEGPGAGYDPVGIPGIGAPDGGKAHHGVRSMHWGRHLSTPSCDEGNTTVRYRQIAAFVVDSQDDPNLPGLVIGPTTTLEFWHNMKMCNDENCGSGFLPPGGTFGGGQIHISLLGASGRFEKWTPVNASFNGPSNLINSTISICQFDPGDDQLPPSNDTMCSTAAPMYADMGSTIGTDPTCTMDTTGQDPAHKDCGRISSCSGGPGCAEIGSLGTGVWVRSAFNLSPFAGRLARLRWIGSQGGGWSFGTDRSAIEPSGGICYAYNQADDGWFVDDIKLTDLRVSPSIMAGDPVTGLSQCQPGQQASACGVVDITVAGSTAFVLPTDPAGRLLQLDAPGQPVSLDARASAAADDPATPGVVEGACDAGVLLARWTQIDPAGVQLDEVSPFSPAAEVKVAPVRDTTYRVEMKCTTDLTCAAQRDVLVQVYPGDGGDISLDLTGGATATLSWRSRPQPPGLSGYDVFRLTAGGPATGVDVFTAGTFDGACLTNAVAQPPAGALVTSTDTTPPAPGTVFMYQVGHSSASPAALAPLGVAPAGPRAGQLMASGVACP